MSIQVIIDQRDLNSLKNSLKGLELENLLKNDFEEFGLKVIDIAKVYPPPQTNTVRTGNLGNSWLFRALSPEELDISNSATYAGYVQGDAQRDFHKEHGWLTIFDITDSEMDKLMLELDDKVDDTWEK